MWVSTTEQAFQQSLQNIQVSIGNDSWARLCFAICKPCLWPCCGPHRENPCSPPRFELRFWWCAGIFTALFDMLSRDGGTIIHWSPRTSCFRLKVQHPLCLRLLRPSQTSPAQHRGTTPRPSLFSTLLYASREKHLELSMSAFYRHHHHLTSHRSSL